MTPRTLTLTLTLALANFPLAAQAQMPAPGAIMGTNPETASAALKAAGCEVTEFDAEGGKIEAKCTETATGKLWEVYLDPKTGAVTAVKSEKD